MDQETRNQIQQVIGYTFTDMDLLTEAFTHASLAENRLASNERLEFLGDAVLGAVVCEYLFEQYPDLLEGDLTKIKSTAVSRRTCARISKALSLDEYLMLGKGMITKSRVPPSLAAAVFEAIIAAIYLDGGIEPARTFILDQLSDIIGKAADSGHQQNFKSILQQYAQRCLGQAASYVLLDENGPDHAKCFEVAVEIGGTRHESSWASNKKQAEQQAALNALMALEVVCEDEENGEIVLIKDVNGVSLVE
ncbi:MAG: ribonuclease III [Planctomycetes bacterium]|nr:ribonuclease III [Planctomycetota bacterium]NOG54719.1 ribonuclease III [Planctomycetota bacterium]